MAKKGIVKQISKYSSKHPYVTLALAGTFGYYVYENMIKAPAPLTERQKRAAIRKEVLEDGGDYTDHILRERMKRGY